MHNFKVGDSVTVPGYHHDRLSVAGVHGDYLWLLSSRLPPQTLLAGQCKHIRPEDSDPLTQDWLDRTGLTAGVKCRDWLLKIKLNGEWQLAVTGWWSGVKTIGDARTLVRLLSGKLESDEP